MTHEAGESLGEAPLGEAPPRLSTPVPGPASRALIDVLARHECPAITARRARRAVSLGTADEDPIVWAEALGANVIDADGNRFVDLTAGFGVASAGHRHPAIVAAGQAQLARLPHAMGDVFPDITRIRLMERLTAETGLDRVIFGSSGSDAVEAAIKTALLATGRGRILAFSGGYHGLASAPLAALGYRADAFAAPFRPMLGGHVDLAPFGGAWPELSPYAAVLVEPVQGRGGNRAPPPGWLPALHAAARAAGTLVIHDEVQCGLGRTGRWLAAEHEGVTPDLLTIGKALGGGFPISACLGTAAAMDAWGASTGEAIHTQTFLGNPVGAAMALASLDVLRPLTARAETLGRWLEAALRRLPAVRGVRGRGLMLGVEIADPIRKMRLLLERGYLVLPCGPGPDALGLTPPLTITEAQLDGFVATLAELA